MMKLSAPPSTARPSRRTLTDATDDVIAIERRYRRPEAAAAKRPATIPLFAPFRSAKCPVRGKLPMAASVARLFMAGQAHSALGAAKIITGDVHQRKAIWRIDQTAPEGRYTLDNAGRISEMRDPTVARMASVEKAHSDFE
jgi:hypothetical protein